MPRTQNRERVAVRTDSYRNILGYEVAEQPGRSTMFEKLTPVSHLRSYSQSPNFNRNKTYEEEENNYDYEDKENIDNTTDVSVPINNTRRDPRSRAKRKPRRVRYVPLKPNVKIFDEKLDWDAHPKIDSHNEDATERLRNLPPCKVFRQKLHWHAAPRTDSHNEMAIENFRRMPARYTYHDEKLEWPATHRVIDHNEEYLKNKEQARLLRNEKIYVQDFPQEWMPRADRILVDHHNPEYVEHKKRKQSAKLPPIEDQKFEWKKEPRVNQRNDDYIERIRQYRSIPSIFREKLRWRTKTPKIDAYNQEYVENLKEQTLPTIFNQTPRWKSRSKIDTGLEPDSDEEQYNDHYSTV